MDSSQRGANVSKSEDHNSSAAEDIKIYQTLVLQPFVSLRRNSLWTVNQI